MIKVQATRNDTADAAPTRQTYADKGDPKRSGLPFAILGFITGVVALLKASSTGSAGVQPEAEKPKSGSDDRLDAPAADTVSFATDPDEAQPKPPANVIPLPPRPIGSFPDLQGFLNNDSPPIDYSKLRTEAPHGSSNPPTADASPPSNDNSAKAAGASAGGGAGGGGGGGGDNGGSAGRPPSRPDFFEPDEDGPLPPWMAGKDGPRDTGPKGTDPGRNPEEEDEPLRPGDKRNRAPVVSGPVYLPNVVGCQAYLIPLLALLAGASDADGDTLRITNVVASSGTLVLDEDGGWHFDADPGFRGPVTLTYTISDGHAQVQQVAYLQVVDAPPIIGTSGADNILGTACGDIIDAREGDDNIDARGGNDIVHGGAGDDHILAGAGNDIVLAGAGDDLVFAGSGNDIVFGGAGNDRLFGEDGDDVLQGEDGNDLLSGGDGNDILRAGSGDDQLTGGDGNDTLEGEDGADILHGGAGNDILLAGAGADEVLGEDGDDILSDGASSDTVRGGSGADHVIAAADGASDDFSGDEGVDTLDYSELQQGVVIDVAAGTVLGTESGEDRIAEFEIIIGSRGEDTIVAGSASQDGITIRGNDGDDVIQAGAGDDDLSGDDGDDILSDGSGSDFVRGGSGKDHVIAAVDGASDDFSGDEGADTLDYSELQQGVVIDVAAGTASGTESGEDRIAEFEIIIGSRGDDTIVAVSTSKDGIIIQGEDGDDLIQAGAGDDDLSGDDGDDDISDGAGRDLVDGGSGDDRITAAMDSSDDDYSGGSGEDTLDYSDAKLRVVIDLAAETASGDEIGTDAVSSFEVVIAGKCDDLIIAGATSVVLTGGDGDDEFEFTTSGRDDDAPAFVGRITDFDTGDRLNLQQYSFYRREDDDEDEVSSDLFEQIYLEGTEGGAPIRLRFEKIGDFDHTFIELIDSNDDGESRYSINLDGYHRLEFTISEPAQPVPAI